MMGFIWRLRTEKCAERRVGLEGAGRKRRMCSFKALHASYDKRVVGEGHETRLAREAAVNQE